MIRQLWKNWVLSFFLISAGCLSYAQDPPAPANAGTEIPLEAAFHMGIDAFNKKQWAKAAEAFSQIVAKEPKFALAYYNLGVSEFQLGQKGKALAYLRRALYYDDGMALAAQTLRDAATKVDRPFQARETSSFEYLRSAVLISTSTTVFVVLSAGLLGLTGLMFIWHFVRRRKFIEDGFEPNSFSPLSLISFGLTLFALSLLVVKIVDKATPRVTVIEKRTPLLAGPAQDTLSLMEIPEGNELVLKSVHTDGGETWLNVHLPGSLSGWVLAKHVLISAGETTW